MIDSQDIISSLMSATKTVGHFTFNQFGVCLNPNTITRDDGRSLFRILTAQRDDGRWIHGAKCLLIGPGFGNPCVITSPNSYPTERDAVKAACKVIRKFMEEHKIGSDPCVADLQSKRYSKKLVRLLNEVERPVPKQQSLFE